MIDRLIGLVREAPPQPEIDRERAVSALYGSYRDNVLFWSMVGYGLFYFCRKNYSVAMPLMTESLGYSNKDLGILGSYFYVSYGICKFLSGLVADRASPRFFIVAGLVLSALTNIVFGLSSSIEVLLLLWTVNGCVQSLGAPASAKLVAQWFSISERGTKTGIWNISHQGGGGLVLVIAGLFAGNFGWRGCMIGPALIALGAAFVVWHFLRDRPESDGLPPIEEFRNDPSATEDETRDLSFGTLLVQRLLLNPRVWIVALGSLCTYVVRYGALDWAPKYLYEVRGVKIANAGLLSSLLEFVGIPGALLCGWISDRWLGARRAPVVAISLVLLGASVFGLFYAPVDRPWLTWLALASVGFFTYGPQLLLAGVAPVDVSSKRVAAAAIGFVGMMSYVGATLSSRVTGALLDSASGWAGAFRFWAAAAFVGAAIVLPLWRITPRKTT